MQPATIRPLDWALAATVLVALAQSAIPLFQGIDPSMPMPQLWLPLALAFICGLAIFVTQPLALKLVSNERALPRILLHAVIRACALTVLVGCRAGLPYSLSADAPLVATHAIVVLLAAILAVVVLEWSLPARSKRVFMLCAVMCIAVVQAHALRSTLEAIATVALIGCIVWVWGRMRSWLAPHVAAPVIGALILAAPSAGRVSDLVTTVAAVTGLMLALQPRGVRLDPPTTDTTVDRIVGLAAIPMFGLATITGVAA